MVIIINGDWLLSQETARKIAVEVRGMEEGLNSYINSPTSRAKAAYDRRMSKQNSTNLANFVTNRTKDDARRYMVSTGEYSSPLFRHQITLGNTDRLVMQRMSCRVRG